MKSSFLRAARVLVLFTILLAVALPLMAAGGSEAGKKIKVGVSLPTQEVERWVRDKNNLIKYGEAAGCEVLMQISNNDPVKQNAQVENLISQRIDVLIISPHDADAAATAVAAAKKAGIPVVGFVRLILNADLDAHVSDDFVRTGELQGEFLKKAAPKGNYIILRGMKEDYNWFLFHSGAMKVIQPLIDKGDIKVIVDQHAADWKPENAMKIAENALTATKNKIQAVLSPNDGLAGGAIQALAAQGLAGKVPVTGGDAGQDAARRIWQGTQSMTVFRDQESLADAAIKISLALVKKEDFLKYTKGTIDNGKKQVPVVWGEAITITKENLQLLVDKKYMTWEEIKG
jgi:D-xylose transport system substrate-binding protein